MLPADNLHKDVFKVVLVQGRRGPRVADPEVDGVRLLAQRYPGKRNVPLGIGIQRQILIPEIVVLLKQKSTLAHVAPPSSCHRRNGAVSFSRV